MKRRALVAAALLGFFVGFGGILAAQDFTSVSNDLSLMLGGIGDAVLPNMQQTLIADQGIGAATLGDSRFFIGGSLGVTFAPGLLKEVLDPTRYDVLDITGLMNAVLGNGTGGTGSTQINSYLTTFTNSFPDPDAKVAFGVRTVYGIELIGTFSIVPQALTDFGTGLANLSGITLNSLRVGGRIRKSLLPDTGGFPAVSIGAGYTYATFSAGYTIGDVSFSAGSGYSLDLSGAQLKMGATVQTAGVDLSISKKLSIFTPYVRFMPWYEWASFKASFDGMSLVIASKSLPLTGISSSLSRNDLSFLVAGGVEIRLGPFVLVPGGSYNVLNNTWSGNVSTRLQF